MGHACDLNGTRPLAARLIVEIALEDETAYDRPFSAVSTGEIRAIIGADEV